MAKLTMSNILLIVIPDVVTINEVIRTFGAEQITAKSAMVPSTYQEHKLLRTALTF